MIDHDGIGASLVETQDDARWAFGAGFDDPLAGIDTSTPDGVDGAELARYCLMLADDALVSAQRLAEWSTRAPELEEEVALANLGLDLLGQARLLLARAAAADPATVPELPPGSPVPAEDALAFFRSGRAFRNVRLVELENGDFARSTVRLLVFATWRLALFGRLAESRDPVLAAVAGKGVKELTYHRDYAARWVVTLARGTEYSRARARAGLAEVWPFVAELFLAHPVEQALAAAGVGVDPGAVRGEFYDVLTQVLIAAELEVPDPKAADSETVDGVELGRDGGHTAALDSLLAEMQVLARAHPTGRW